MSEIENVNVEKEDKEVVSKNFIEQIIEKDLAAGVYDTVHTRFPPLLDYKGSMPIGVKFIL